jgi:GAF domain-containing protein
MGERPIGDAKKTVHSLADLQLSEETLDSVMAHIGTLAIEALPGWQAAAASLVLRHKAATFGSTDPRVDPIDQWQYDSQRGACVDAIDTGKIQYFDGTSIPERWRQFAEVAGKAGIYSVLSFPMQVGDEVVGALNLYSTERDALRSGQQEEGAVYAAQAAVTLANAREFFSRGEQVEQLEDGLATRTMIGQATGLLMAQEGLTSEEAFQKLVKISQASNVKLREIAERYIESWENKATPSN